MQKGMKELQISQRIINKVALLNSYLPVVTLNVNVLNSPITRHRVAKQIKKNKGSTICCLQGTHLSFKETGRLKVKG